VSVYNKMAKDQYLSLNTSKISGLCSRLMCCLKYENDAYEEAKKKMPDIGTRVETAEGPGKVVGLNLLEQLLQIHLSENDQVLEYTLDEIMDPNNNMLRSEEHTSELQSRFDLVCRLLLEKKNK